MPLPNSNNTSSHPVWGTPGADPDGNAPLVRPQQDVAFVAAQTINQTGEAEGANIPPQQRGQFRVPVPQGFQVQSSTFNSATLNTTFVLTWRDVVDSANGLNQTQVTNYEVYAQIKSIANSEPTLVGSSSQSPCYAVVNTPQGGTTLSTGSAVTFWLKPQLASGQTLPLSACPTCTSTTTAPFFAVSVTDALTSRVAQVEISGSAPSQFNLSTTAGVSVGWPTAGVPYNAWYSTLSVQGLEAYSTGTAFYGSPASYGFHLASNGLHFYYGPTDNLGTMPELVRIGALPSITSPFGTAGGVWLYDSSGNINVRLDGTIGRVQLQGSDSQINVVSTGANDLMTLSGASSVGLSFGAGGLKFTSGVNTGILKPLSSVSAIAGGITPPATVAGFIDFEINGTHFAIPYYGAP